MTEIGGIILGTGHATSRTPGDLGLTMRGFLRVSDVLGVGMRSQVLRESPRSQLLEAKGMGTDSGAPRRLLTSSPLLCNPARALVDSTRSGSRSEKGVPISALGRALAVSVWALVGFTRTGTRTERGGLVLTTGMVQEWFVAMVDGARRGGRVRNEWRAV